MSKFNYALNAGLLLAGISLYLSASGLTHLFGESSAVILALALGFEGAKVAIVMYLIRHFRWRLLPLGLAASLVLLSGVSSLGIYGSLGRAYNSGRGAAVVSQSEVTTLTASIQSLEADRDRLYRQVEAIPATQGTNRRRVLAQVQPQIRALDAQIGDQRSQLLTATQRSAAVQNDIGDLRYASELFGVPQDRLAMWIITVLAFLLDPLALMLLLASGKRGLAEPAARAVESPVAPAAPATVNATVTLPRFALSAVPAKLADVITLGPAMEGLSRGGSTLLSRFRRRRTLA
jgi:hypothetical protein